MTLDKKLNDAFEEMMKYRQSIGYATATYRSSVPPFINFCVKNHPLSARITQEMVDEWLIYYPYTVNSKSVFLSLLREYTKYLNFLGYDDYIPDDDYVVKRIAFNPYLFTDDELSGLFKMIDSYVGKTCGKRYLPEIVLPVYSRLLYCCGLRPQEPPAIRTEDVNLITGDVYIRQSKRHKDRHIIMSEDMRALCQKYDSVAGKRQWFFQKWDGTPYEASWYNQIWRNLISKSGISWKGTPRPYDLRHAFASRNIIRWINNVVLCQYLVQVKMRNFSHFNPPEAQPQCVFFYTIVRIHLVTYSYNGYEFVSYCRKLPDIRKSSGMPACNREF